MRCRIRLTPAHRWPRRTRIARRRAGRRNTGWSRRSCVRATANDHAHSVGVVCPSIACASSAPPARRHQQSHASHFHRLDREIQGDARIVILCCRSLTVSLYPRIEAGLCSSSTGGPLVSSWQESFLARGVVRPSGDNPVRSICCAACAAAMSSLIACGPGATCGPSGALRRGLAE
jgi:hypothetical protein